MRNLILLFSITIMIISCNSEKTLTGFDKNTWLSDNKGCAGKRILLVNSILENRKEWKGLDDDYLLELLGKPDQSFYYERNAKSFAFYIEPGKQCKNSSNSKFGRRLVAEINATGFVNLIRVEN